MKLNSIARTGICTWSLCMLAVLPGTASAHPGADVQGKGQETPGGNGPRSSGSTSGANREAVATPQKDPKALGANAPAQAGPPANEGPKQQILWIEDQILKGYKGNVQLYGRQASHQHEGNDPKAWELRLPLEIWYLATVKRPENGGLPFYCVAPRVENPSGSKWETSFLVTLVQGDSDNGSTVMSKQVDAVPPGGSMEVFSHCEQGARPSWVIKTPHGKARVNFSGSIVPSGNPPTNERR